MKDRLILGDCLELAERRLKEVKEVEEVGEIAWMK